MRSPTLSLLRRAPRLARLSAAMAWLGLSLGASAQNNATTCPAMDWQQAECWQLGLPVANQALTVRAIFSGDNRVVHNSLSNSPRVGKLSIASLAPIGFSANIELLLSGGQLRSGWLLVGERQLDESLQGNGLMRVSGGLLQTDALNIGRGAHGQLTLSGGGIQAGYVEMGWPEHFSQATALIQGGLFEAQRMVLIGAGAQWSQSGGEARFSTGVEIKGGGISQLTVSGGRFEANSLAVGLEVQRGNLMLTQNALAEANTLRVNLGQALVSGNASFSAGVLGVGGSDALLEQRGGLITASRLELGGDGSSRWLQTGGQLNAGTLSMAEQAGHSALLRLSGGEVGLAQFEIGRQGSARLEIVGGRLQASSGGSLGASSSLLQTGGELQIGSLLNRGLIEMQGGRFAGSLVNEGEWRYGRADDASAGPQLDGLIINRGRMQVFAQHARFAGGLDQQSETALDLLGAGRVIEVGGVGLRNSGSLLLRGGSLIGAGRKQSEGLIEGHGLIGGAGIDNLGLLRQSGGSLRLDSSDASFNQGRWELAAQRLQLLGSSELDNQGLLLLQGGRVDGSGLLRNGAAGVIAGSGRISSGFANEGTLAIASGEQLRIEQEGWENLGVISLGGASAQLAGGTLQHKGLLLGQGRVANAVKVEHDGRLVADGGTLVFSGEVRNEGSLVARQGSSLLFHQGLTQQAGLIQLEGGSFDNNGQTLTNGGTLQGHGLLRVDGIDNEGALHFSGGHSVVYGGLLNRELSETRVSGASSLSLHGDSELRDNSLLRVAEGSTLVVFGLLRQREGALMEGGGRFDLEGGLLLGEDQGEGAALQAQGQLLLGRDASLFADIGSEGHDRLSVDGLLGFGGSLVLSLGAGFSPEQGQRFDLFDWTQSSGQFTRIDLSGAGLSGGLRWDMSRLYVDGSIAVVPEPGSWALMAAGLLLLTGRKFVQPKLA